MASWLSISRLCIIIFPNLQSIGRRKTDFKHHCFLFSNIYQKYLEKMEWLTPTSGQIPPTSGYFDWLHWHPPMAYSTSGQIPPTSGCFDWPHWHPPLAYSTAPCRPHSQGKNTDKYLVKGKKRRQIHFTGTVRPAVAALTGLLCSLLKVC